LALKKMKLERGKEKTKTPKRGYAQNRMWNTRSKKRAKKKEKDKVTFLKANKRPRDNGSLKGKQKRARVKAKNNTRREREKISGSVGNETQVQWNGQPQRQEILEGGVGRKRRKKNESK